MDHGSPQDQSIRVVIADDEARVIDYVRLALECEGDDIDLVGVATDAGSTIDTVGETHPDVLLLDLQMPGGGLSAAQLVSSLTPETRVIVFTAETEGTELLALLRAGISGYVLKSTPPSQLVDSIRAVATGHARFAPNITERGFEELTTRLHSERNSELHLERRRRRIERTIRNHEFTTACQPIVDLASGETHAIETLTRFHGLPEQPPNRWFIEASSVSRGIDLELATARAALDLLGSIHDRLPLSINLSPAAILSGRLNMLLEGTEPARVILELTEHAAVDDYEILNVTLRRWRDQGVRIAIDDAGAGYASFAHVLHAQPDYIKLDLSLIHGIDEDPARQALARAMIGFARELHIHVIAEGIETTAELETMSRLGAHYGQGYYLGRPKPLDEQPHLRHSNPEAAGRAHGGVIDGGTRPAS